MNNLKVRKSSLMLSVIILSLLVTPLLATKGETYQLVYSDFYIEASKPEVLAEMDFSLNNLNDYVFGLPLEAAVGTFTASRTYFFEIWTEDNKRVEIFILDSNDYLDYERDFIGAPPTAYFMHEICDGYRQLEFTNSSISPKLILYSEGEDVTGNFIWTEGLAEIIYQPYYQRILESDRTTQDSVQIFNVNASVSCYVMTQDEFDAYVGDPNDRPTVFSASVAAEEDSFNITLEFETIKDPNTDPEVENHYHLLIWHEEFYGGVSGTIIYEYEYARAFGETYWSLIFAILLLVCIVLFFAFQKVVLPPVVWSLSKLRYYVLSIPGKYIRETFFDLREELGSIWSKMKGVEEIEIEAEKEYSPHSRLLLLFQGIIGFIGLQRYMVGKTGTAIVFTCTFGFLGIGYLIDLVAIITGSFYDSDDKQVFNWV